MEETISLKDIFEILKTHLATIIISMFVGLGIAGIVTFFIITPKYESQAQLIVKLPRAENSNTQDVNANLLMINTYKDLITGDLVMGTVKNRLESEYNLEMTMEEIREAIQVEQSQNSQMFSIVGTNNKAVNAEHIANTTASVFQDNVKDVMDVDKISIISNAQASMNPVYPNNKLILSVGLVLGLMVGVGLAFLLELLDHTVKDNRFITENLNFTILGTVPQMNTKEVKQTTNSNGKKSVQPANAVTTKAPSRHNRSLV